MRPPPALVCPRCRGVLDAAGAEISVNGCPQCGAVFPVMHGVTALMAAPAEGTVEAWQKAIYDELAHPPYGGWRLGRAPDVTLTYWSHCRQIAALCPAPGEVVLDVGCLGGQRLLEIAAAYDVTGVGIDLSTAAVRAARAAHHPRLRFHAASAEAIPLPDASVDVAIAMDVLEHTRTPLAVVKEVRRCLRPGGRFLAHVPVTDIEGTWDGWQASHDADAWRARALAIGHDYRRMPSSHDLETWFAAAGFREVRVRRFNAWHQNRFDYHAVHRILNTLFFVWKLPMALYHDGLIHLTKVWYLLDLPRLRRGIGASVYVTGRC